MMPKQPNVTVIFTFNHKGIFSDYSFNMETVHANEMPNELHVLHAWAAFCLVILPLVSCSCGVDHTPHLFHVNVIVCLCALFACREANTLRAQEHGAGRFLMAAALIAWGPKILLREQVFHFFSGQVYDNACGPEAV